MKCLVRQQWHYIVHETLGEELYDWVNDPREGNNLAKTAEGQVIARENGGAIGAVA